MYLSNVKNTASSVRQEIQESDQTLPSSLASVLENRTNEINTDIPMEQSNSHNTNCTSNGDYIVGGAINHQPSTYISSKDNTQEYPNQSTTIEESNTYMYSPEQNNENDSSTNKSHFTSPKNPITSANSRLSKFKSAITTTPNGANGVAYKCHRRNVSNMSGKPLISDDQSSSSDIYCSDEDDGDVANCSLNTGHQENQSHLSSTIGEDQLIVGSGGTTDDYNQFNIGRNKHESPTSHIINVNDQEEEDSGLNNKEKNNGIPNEPLKTFLALIFLLMAFISTTASLAFIHDRVPFDTKPLPDLILDNVKYQHWGLDASEILIMILVWSAFIITIFHKHRFIVLRRIFLMCGLHYFYRSVTMTLTLLPVADDQYKNDVCSPQANQTSAFTVGQRVVKLISGMGLSINGQHVYCGDYIYSGHTMTLIMACLVIKEYSPRRWVLLHYAAIVISIAGVVTLLIARGHYSIDVIIAYWITTRIWWIFHTLADNANLKEMDGFGPNKNNYLTNLWWWYIFRYFECNVPVCLPHRFNWPIPSVLLHCKPVQWLSTKVGRSQENRPSVPAASKSGNVDSILPATSNQATSLPHLSNVAAVTIAT